MECDVTKMKNILFVSAVRRMLKPLTGVNSHF